MAAALYVPTDLITVNSPSQCALHSSYSPCSLIFRNILHHLILPTALLLGWSSSSYLYYLGPAQDLFTKVDVSSEQTRPISLQGAGRKTFKCHELVHSTMVLTEIVI